VAVIGLLQRGSWSEWRRPGIERAAGRLRRLTSAVPRLRPSSWGMATKNRATEFRPTARGTPDGHWPPGDLRDGQEPTARSAKGAGQGAETDVVCHVPTPPQLAIFTGTRRVRWQNTVVRFDSSIPELPGQVERCTWRVEPAAPCRAGGGFCLSTVPPSRAGGGLRPVPLSGLPPWSAWLRVHGRRPFKPTRKVLSARPGQLGAPNLVLDAGCSTENTRARGGSR
jgi:hypothetical protein